MSWFVLYAVVTGLAAVYIPWKIINTTQTKGKNKHRRPSVFTDEFVRGAYPGSLGYVLDNIICGLMRFDTLPDKQAFLDKFDTVIHLPGFERLQSIPSFEARGEFVWKDMQDFPWREKLVFEKTLKDEAEVLRYIEDVSIVSMSRDRPLWDVHFLHVEQGSQCILFRIHHAIGDGTSLVKVLLELIDYSESFNGKTLDDMYKKRVDSSKTKKPWSVFAAVSYVIWSIRKFFESLIQDSVSMLRHSEMPYEFSGKRLCIISPPTMLPLSRLKEVQTIVLEKYGKKTTINDIVASILSGGVRRYLEFVEDPVLKQDKILIQACTPFAMPPPKNDDSFLHNRFVICPAKLAVNIPLDQPIERLFACQETYVELKRAQLTHYIQLIVTELLARWLTLSCRREVTTTIVEAETLFFSNVRGPDRPISVLGQPVVALNAFFAVMNHFISAFSYNGYLQVSWTIDDAFLKKQNSKGDGKKLVEYFSEEWSCLQKALGM